MSFRLPAWSIVVNLWRWSSWEGSFLSLPAPDTISVANLAIARRRAGRLVQVSYLLLPFDTYITSSQTNNYDSFPSSDPDAVECPAGSGRLYTVIFTDYVSLGFPTQHQFAEIYKGYCQPFPTNLGPLVQASYSGVVDGINTNFVIDGSFSSLLVHNNGMTQTLGNDYTLSGNTITFIGDAVPQPGDNLLIVIQ